MVARGRQTPGRNEPCWCGSGKKYKKCHLAADEKADEEHQSLAIRARDYQEIQRGVLKP
jgi:hypothetical protein